MEQQVTDLTGAIGEMDATIQRLQEQLRRLDIETEAQVLFRQEQMAQHEEFDPLEMDRYSQLQQLSRSLIESASDLMDLKYTLSDKTRDTETLLLQQSRINTDLQEGLMRSRMVPFSRLVPRLRRIVRQAATELGKEVDFDLDNVEGEMDRTVLERMVAPLEHMLRNAVDHGIELPADRAASGKSANGRVLLSLAREGSEVVLRLKDDGRGINLKRVREKAIERGLMAADAKLTDEDIIQFILHAGFSTAEKVTQISGRGVGMDVVASEIKQLGGNMLINSVWGQGTEFEVRLPFTVSVNRALMIQIGEDLYAVPLNTIEGIVRVSPFELEHYYQDPTAVFDYAGENYLVRYLGGLLDSDTKPKLDGQGLPLPVILVRSADQTVALQVDRLLGSREIVVKTLGMQFGSVRGVSGATIMGDGSVVVILDLHAVIREQRALNLQLVPMDLPSLSAPAAEEDTSEKTIMVVDDSVTVRKVTSRFLEREGFRVITAKDGAEALQVLQDQIPDLMLLDIEMPRMDGFEVAKNVRSSSRMKGLPIIMITSRTGDKHRDRAFSLGVNKYMGKPYQEDLLLSNIRELLKQQVH
jgi:chemosensory pili system protein ChpA (sensor histidine kinase/response regulator)